MATLGMMYHARGGLVWGQVRGCDLKSGVPHRSKGGLCNIMVISYHNFVDNTIHSTDKTGKTIAL